MIKHLVKLSRSFHSGIVFIISSLIQFRARHYEMQLTFDFKGELFAESRWYIFQFLFSICKSKRVFSI